MSATAGPDRGRPTEQFGAQYGTSNLRTELFSTRVSASGTELFGAIRHEDHEEGTRLMLATPLPRHPACLPGGDLTVSRPGEISLDLSICSNRLGPPPSALAKLQSFLQERPGDLAPPPYGTEKRYRHPRSPLVYSLSARRNNRIGDDLR